MNNQKLLECVATYFPYQLPLAVKTIKGVKVFNSFKEGQSGLLFKKHFKLILRPLSDLNKRDLDIMYFEIIGTDNDMYGSRIEFEDYFNETDINHLPFCIVKYLISKHYDINRLIEKGYAININDLKPHKDCDNSCMYLCTEGFSKEHKCLKDVHKR